MDEDDDMASVETPTFLATGGTAGDGFGMGGGLGMGVLLGALLGRNGGFSAATMMASVG